MLNSLVRQTLFFCGVLFSLVGAHAAGPDLPLKAGMIGLDAHALPWTEIINDPEAEGLLADMQVIAGYPGGSPDIPQSMRLLKERMGAIGDYRGAVGDYHIAISDIDSFDRRFRR